MRFICEQFVNREQPALAAKCLGACRTWGVESENRPQRGQFFPDLQAHSPTMGQKDGEKWTAAVDLQPTISKSDRLLPFALPYSAADQFASADTALRQKPPIS